MNRINSFLVGVLLGVAVTFGSLRYHFVRASDGFHFVPKLTSQFGDMYVDVRSFDLADWDKHRPLAVALVKADKGYLLKDAASESLRNSVDSALDALSGGD